MSEEAEEDNDEEVDEGSSTRRRREESDGEDETEIRDSFVFRDSDADFRESEIGPPRDSELEFRETEIIDRESRSFEVKKKKKPNFFQVIFMTVCVCGVSFSWCMYLVSVRGFMLDLGIDENIVRWWIYLVPPFVNMITQVCIGWLSDCCYAPFFGRRKVYFTIGLLLLLCFYFLSSHSDWIGLYIFPFFPGFEKLFLFLTFPFVIFSLSTCFLLMRALIADKIPQSLQMTANSSFNFFYSLGFLLSFVVFEIPFPLFINFYYYSMKIYFLISFVVIVVPYCCCFCCIKEERYSTRKNYRETTQLTFEEVEPLMPQSPDNTTLTSSSEEEDERGTNPRNKKRSRVGESGGGSEKERLSILKRLKSLRYTFYLTIAIQFFSYFGRTAIIFFAIDFYEYQIVDESVLTGYIWGYLSLVIYFLCSAMVSPMISGVNIIVPSKCLWFFFSMLQVVGMLSFPFIYNAYVACAVFGVLGFTEASINTIPWTVMMGTLYRREEDEGEEDEKEGKKSEQKEYRRNGLFIGIFNFSECVSVFFVASFSYSLRLLFTEVFHFPFGIVLSIISVPPALIASVLILFVKEPRKHRWITCGEICTWFFVTPVLKVMGRVSWEKLEEFEYGN